MKLIYAPTSPFVRKVICSLVRISPTLGARAEMNPSNTQDLN